MVRQGLTHMVIPSGWSWGGPVSEYCPLWIELYAVSNPRIKNCLVNGDLKDISDLLATTPITS